MMRTLVELLWVIPATKSQTQSPDRAAFVCCHRNSAPVCGFHPHFGLWHGFANERFGDCEWLTAADADGFLDKSTLTVQRTGAGSCMMFDREANTMTVAVIATSRDTVVSMTKRTGPCRHVAIPELGNEAFGEHSCTKGNGNTVNIYVRKNGRQASILFASVKPHQECGSGG